MTLLALKIRHIHEPTNDGIPRWLEKECALRISHIHIHALKIRHIHEPTNDGIPRWLEKECALRMKFHIFIFTL
jgi:uncharacterized membrane protein YhdT